MQLPQQAEPVKRVLIADAQRPRTEPGECQPNAAVAAVLCGARATPVCALSRRLRR